MKAFLLSIVAMVVIVFVADFAINDGAILDTSSGAVWQSDNVRLD